MANLRFLPVRTRAIVTAIAIFMGVLVVFMIGANTPVVGDTLEDEKAYYDRVEAGGEFADPSAGDPGTYRLARIGFAIRTLISNVERFVGNWLIAGLVIALIAGFIANQQFRRSP
jgi:hypothetical protein